MLARFTYLRYPAAVAVLLVAGLLPLLAGTEDLAEFGCRFAVLMLQGLVGAAPGDASAQYIETNLGQAAREYQFYSRRTGGVPALFSDEGLVIDLGQRTSPGAVVKVQLTGAARIRPRGEDRLPTQVNYLLGNDPSRWIVDVPAYARVRYPAVYPGIDAIYYPQGQYFEQDFEVRPGADPSLIRMRFAGADSVRIDEHGAVRIEAGKDTIVWNAPRVYQAGALRKRVSVDARYRLDEAGNVAFELGSYDRGKTLVIDPVITFSTYFGRSGADVAGRSAIDAQGNLYFAGQTDDTAFPVVPGVNPAPQSPASTGNATLVKLNASGTAALIVTHFGGSVSDLASAVAVDAAGNIYLTGITDSGDFPTTAGAFRAQSFANDRASCFVTKFNPAANRILYSTLLGGRDLEACSAIAVDSTGAAYVAGATASRDFPATPDTFQPVYRAPSATPGYDGFITKLNPAGSALVYSTFLGGPGNDVITSMALDAERNVYVAGYTNSPNFPVTQRAYQPRYGGGSSALFDFGFPVGDAFAAKINGDGSSLVYSTYLGGREDDVALSIAVDRTGSAYIAGGTRSTNFPVTPAAYQSTYRGAGGETRYPAGDGFVVKLKPDGSALDYGTYLGGSFDDRVAAVAVDRDGNAWLTGHTLSTDFPVSTDARQRTFAGSAPTQLITLGDAFAFKLNPSGERMLYSTYHGGSGNEAGYGIVLAQNDEPVVSGATGSTNLFTTPGALQPQGGIGEPDAAPFNDLFVFRIGEAPAIPVVSIAAVANEASLVPDVVSPGMIVSITGENLATAEATAAAGGDGRLPDTLRGTRVWFGGAQARILSVSPRKIVAAVPFALEPGSTVALSVEASQGNRSAAKQLSVAEASPGLYPNNATNEDGSANGEGNPALPGSVLTLTGTGAGRNDPLVDDGAVVAAGATANFALPALVLLGEPEVEIVQLATVEGQVAGRFRLRIRIPEGLPAGWHAVSLRIGDAAWSQGEYYVYAGDPSATAQPQIQRRRGAR